MLMLLLLLLLMHVRVEHVAVLLIEIGAVSGRVRRCLDTSV
jgi:hypothetical protein